MAKHKTSNGNGHSPKSRKRISPLRDFHPWRYADKLTKCDLFWLSAVAFPIPAGQRDWLMLFVDRLAELLDKKLALRAELFWQARVIQSLLGDATMKNNMQLPPVLGLLRAPGGQERGTQADSNNSSREYGYWFVDKGERRTRELFLGLGGMMMLFMKPDPAATAPKLPLSPKFRVHPMFKQLFEQIDVDRLHSQAYALLDGFQQRSKELFGAGLQDDPGFKGSRFVMPLLRTADFFEQPEEQFEKWFSLFDVYVSESPSDQGILMASRLDLKEDLAGLLDGMKEEGLEYPER